MSRTAISRTVATTEIEAALIERIASGDACAFDELYERMRRRVLGLAFRVLRDPAQAEEIAQEVFLEVWQLAARFEAAKGTGVSWVLSKAHCKAVDRVRSTSARTVRDRNAGLRNLAETEDSIADLVELRIESERVGRALKALPDTQREVITLSHLAGYSHTEVSEILNIPIGTVKTRIRSGISRLREELAAAA